MKMKKVILGCSVLVATALFIAGCKKDKTQPEPAQDTDFQSTKEAVYANSIALDLEQIAAYMGEGQLLTNYLGMAPGSSGAITTTVLPNNHIQVVYSGSVTCRDGKKREGIVDLYYTSSPASYSANAYRDPGYVATVNLTNYWVDGWRVNDVDPLIITNVTAFSYNTASDKLKWTIKGKLSIVKASNPNDSMSWEGDLTKVLTNTNNNAIMAPTKLLPIAWTSTNVANTAKLEYTGGTKGLTIDKSVYTFSVDAEKPLVRDYACSPDKVLGINTTPSVSPVYSLWHPVIGGVASFTPGTKEPRKIDFSNAGVNDCDNAGVVTIKGVDSPVDFMK